MTDYLAAGAAATNDIRKVLAGMSQPLTVNDALHLFVALSDKGSVAGTLERLLQAANEARAQLAKVEAAQAELDRKSAILDQRLATADAAIAEKRAEAERRMNDERAELDRREKVLLDREAVVQKIKSQAAAYLQKAGVSDAA
jgi:hypothetical protein